MAGAAFTRRFPAVFSRHVKQLKAVLHTKSMPGTLCLCLFVGNNKRKMANTQKRPRALCDILTNLSS